MTESAKRKVSLTLDADLVAEVERSGGNLSAQVNAALRDEVGRRRRQRLLREYLDRLDAERGPVDETEVDRYMRLLSGVDGPSDT